MAKKKSVLLILIVMLAFFAFAGLASCGNPTDSSTGDSETVKETETAGQTETIGETTSETAGETTSETTGETTSESTVAPEVKYVVKFMNGETEVKSIEVKAGEKVAQADIPAAPQSDYEFYGWFNGEIGIDPDAAVTKDAVYVAKFSTIKTEHIGEWRGEGKDGNMNPVAYVLNVTGEDVSLKVGAADAVAATDIAYDEEYGDLTFKLDGVAYILGQSWGGYVLATDDYSVNVGVSLVYHDAVEFGEDALVGTFETEAGVKIEINSTFVIIDDVPGTDFDFYYTYTFYIDGKSASIFYESGAWYYSVDGENDKIKIPEKEPVAIPEAFIGNWSAVVEDGWGTTVYLVTITSKGISVYTDAVGWSDVVASYEAVEGGVIFNIGGENVTVTAAADGKIKFDGEYAGEITLEKKIRIAFVNDYQIYYVAVLKDDGTIDDDNFELEDPAKEHYNFDGWFNQIDDVQFDDTATFEKGAYFEAKWTEIEIPVKFDENTIYVPVTDGVAKLTDVLIPAAPAAAEEGKVFMGWFNGNVKAVAGLEVKKDAKFVSYFASEADFDGYWIYDVDKKEQKLVIDAATHTLTFGAEASVEYTFGEDIYAEKKNGSKTAYKLNITISKDGTLTVVHGHPDADGYDWEEDVYTGFKKVVAVTEIKDGVYKFDKNDYLEFKDGFLTKVNGSVPIFGFVEGTVKSLTIKYKASSYGSATKIEKARYTKDRIICGTLKDNAKIYVWNSESVVNIYCGADKEEDRVNLYVHSVVTKATEEGAEDVKSTVYVVKKGNKYAEATVEGEITVGNIITVTYRFVEGSKFDNFNEQYKILTATTMVAAGAEKGEHTNETLGTLKLDGFGNATLTSGEEVDTYVYVINGAGVVLLKDSDGNIVSGVKLVEENKFEQAAVIGEYGYFIKSDDNKYSLTLDGFGGIVVLYKGSYSSSEYIGAYIVAEDGSIVATGSNLYNYKGTWTVAEGGKVLINGNMIFVADGYIPVNHIDEFVGYYVNGDNAIKIVVADGKVTVLVNKVDVKAKANWNGTEITYNAVDPDSPISGVKTDYIVTKDGENIVVKYKKCIGFDSDGAPDFAADYTTLNYTAAEEPAELDAFAGTWVSNTNSSLKFKFDGKGIVTVVGANEGSYAYTVNGNTSTHYNSVYYETITCVLKSETTMTVNDEYGEWLNGVTFTKQADEEELDGLQGTYKAGSNVIVLNGDGTGTYNNGTEYSFTYTLNSGSKYDVSNFAGYDDDENTITITATGLTVHFSGCYGDDQYNATFVKQA